MANSINASRISHLDIYPTLQNIVHPKQRTGSLDGRDLSPLFAGSEWSDRSLYFHFPVYLQSSATIEGLRDPLFRTRPGSVIVAGQWKLHHYFEDDSLELYNLKNDISEKVNLVRSEPKMRDSLYHKLDRWRTNYRAPIPKTLNPEYDAQFEAKQIQEKLSKSR